VKDNKTDWGWSPWSSGLQTYMLFTSTFFTFFSKSKKNLTFYVFCRVSCFLEQASHNASSRRQLLVFIAASMLVWLSTRQQRFRAGRQAVKDTNRQTDGERSGRRRKSMFFNISSPGRLNQSFLALRQAELSIRWHTTKYRLITTASLWWDSPLLHMHNKILIHITTIFWASLGYAGDHKGLQ